MISCDHCKQEIKLNDYKKYDEDERKVYHGNCFYYLNPCIYRQNKPRRKPAADKGGLIHEKKSNPFIPY